MSGNSPLLTLALNVHPDLNVAERRLVSSAESGHYAVLPKSLGSAYLRAYLWAHIIIGWALTTLAVAGFSGIVRKD